MKDEKYYCPACKYLVRPENFCGCCMVRILSEMKGEMEAAPVSKETASKKEYEENT